MKNRWSDSEATEFVEKHGKRWGKELTLRTYSSRLLGVERELVLHGGGNTSVKGDFVNVLGESIPALFVKASGRDLASIGPEGHVGLALENLKRLRALSKLQDEAMVNELLTNRFDSGAPTPSIETLLHAFIRPKWVDHTHADSILTLTNQAGGEDLIKEALGSDVVIIEYVRPGFVLAKAVAAAFDASSASRGIVLMKHGLLTWGASARESYERTIELVTKAEEYLASGAAKKARASGLSRIPAITSTAMADERYVEVAPLLRGLLTVPTEDPDRPYQRFVLQSLIETEVLRVVDSDWGRDVALTPPLTTDHLIRTKPLPLWIDRPHYGDEKALRQQLSAAIDDYAAHYDAYIERNTHRMETELKRFDSVPRVVLMPGLGAVCVGRDVEEAAIVKDITAQTLAAKTRIAMMGSYEGLAEEHLFDMEYYGPQQAKLDQTDRPQLRGSVGLVTGAAGAIGSGICQELLKNGCHVAVTDLPGDNLDSLVHELRSVYGKRVIGVPLDVTDPKLVAKGFQEVTRAWGGVDLVVANAGVAHVSPLADIDTEAFRKLEQVNVEGTLHLLSESARCFGLQGTGGDIVLISTKNVFAPGAGFGAYSASKAAAHQLARIASLEFAEMDVRVNMVAPDAVFAHGQRKSGLWAEVGPNRMRARGLSESDLEKYYQDRNLLKAKITAAHVAKAVLYFATRQTPTTGATIPVDGGLPGATPR
ncbi:MAG: hypothetical protein AMJ46_00050 [Latescibacteria bacterium DG_63]|nr:MAG: hypothetical protein AMJ46_00050 [Latescibacteria bacterium DG_63]